MTGRVHFLSSWNTLKVSSCCFLSFLCISHSYFILPARSEFTSGSHRAGSGGDQALANKIQKKLNAYGLTTWNDEHFVKVQDPPVGYNKFVFKNASKGEYPRSFLSYSASKNVTVMKKLHFERIFLSGKLLKARITIFFAFWICFLAQGAVLYAFYGEERDFSELQKAQINMNGKVMLVRAGRISFAEKVGVFVWKRADWSFLPCLFF